MSHTDLKHKLVTIGLSEKEAEVYMALLQYGQHPTTFIARKVGLNRGTTYNILHNLLQRGLVTKGEKRGMQFFSPLEPGNLMNNLNRQEEILREQKSLAAETIPELRSISPQVSPRPSVQYFTGPDGVQAALEETLMAKNKTLLAYSSCRCMDELLGDYFGGTYTDERIRRGYSLRSIQSLQNDAQALYHDDYFKKYGASDEHKREVRYVRSDLAFPMTMYIYDQKVLVISSKDENFALITISKEYSDMQRKVFYEMWDSLDPVPSLSCPIKC